MLLNKNQIIEANDLPHLDVDMPEWGGQVRVRVMTAQEHINWGNDIKDLPDSDAPFYLIVKCCIDENGKPLFDGEKDIDFLRGKNARSILKLFNSIIDFNKMNEGAIEDSAKNS